MINSLKGFWQIAQTASSKRTLGLLALLIVVAAVPLTVMVSQQKQDLRQRASGSICQTVADCGSPPNFCNKYTCDYGSGEDKYCNTVPDHEGEICDDVGEKVCKRGFCSLGQSPTSTPTPTPTPSQSCESLSDANYQYRCLSIEECDPNQGWSVSRNRNCSRLSEDCCYRRLSYPTPTARPTTSPNDPTPTPPPSGTYCVYSLPDGTCYAGTTAYPGSCRPGFSPCFNPYLCNYTHGPVTCPTQTGDTPTPTPGQQNPTSTPTPTPGRGGPNPTSTPVPTARPGQAPACDPTKIQMSVSPSNPQIGSDITFNVSGTQGSAWIGDSWTGGVNCTGEFWGIKTCRTTAGGAFTWTHSWKNCIPNDTNNCPVSCSKQKEFQVQSSNITPTPGLGTIKGTVWDDTKYPNGVRQSDEPLIAGIWVCVNPGVKKCVKTENALNNLNGNYKLENIVTGNHTVFIDKEDALSLGWTPIGLDKRTTVPPALLANQTVTASFYFRKAAILNLSLALGGIGSDINVSGGGIVVGNKDPKTRTRKIGIEVFSLTNERTPVATSEGNIVYNTTSQKFEGKISLGASFVNGNYTVKVKTDKYLRKQIGKGEGDETQFITAGQENNMSATLIAGDITNDNLVDARDYNLYYNCFGDRNSASCGTGKKNIDLNDDGIIDSRENMKDYLLLLYAFSQRNGD